MNWNLSTLLYTNHSNYCQARLISVFILKAKSPKDTESFFRHRVDEMSPLCILSLSKSECVCTYGNMECSVGRLIKAMTGRWLKMENASRSGWWQSPATTEGEMTGEEEAAVYLKKYESSA